MSGEKRVIATWEDTDPGETRFGTVVIDEKKCTGCSWCVDICPARCLEIVEEKAKMTETFGCMFCACCQAICAGEAIALGDVPEYPGYYVTIERGELKKPRLSF